MDRIHRIGMPTNTSTTYHIPILQCAIEKVVNQRLAARQKQLYALLEDDMPVVGYPDDSFLIDDENDVGELFKDLIKEIQNTGGTRTPRSTAASRASR